MTVLLVVSEANERRAADFCRAHRHGDIASSEFLSDLAAAFEKVAREARAAAFKDAASWIEHIGRCSSSEHAKVVFHCVNVIRARAGDPR